MEAMKRSDVNEHSDGEWPVYGHQWKSMVNMDLHGEKHDLYMIYIYYHLVIEQFAMENHHFE